MRMSAEFFSRHAHMRDFDQLERGFVHRPLEGLVAFPVAIGFLDDDAALEQQALEHALDVELVVLRVAHAERGRQQRSAFHPALANSLLARGGPAAGRNALAGQVNDGIEAFET